MDKFWGDLTDVPARKEPLCQIRHKLCEDAAIEMAWERMYMMEVTSDFGFKIKQHSFEILCSWRYCF